MLRKFWCGPSDVHFLLTIEDRKCDLQVVKLENGSATVDLAVKPEYAPNTYVSVTAVVSGTCKLHESDCGPAGF